MSLKNNSSNISCVSALTCVIWLEIVTTNGKAASVDSRSKDDRWFLYSCLETGRDMPN